MKEKWSDLQWLTGFQRQPELGGCRSADPSRSPLEVLQCRVFRKRMSGGIIISQFGLPIPIPPPPPPTASFTTRTGEGAAVLGQSPLFSSVCWKGVSVGICSSGIPLWRGDTKKTCAQLCNCTNRKWRLWQGHLRSCCALFQTFEWKDSVFYLKTVYVFFCTDRTLSFLTGFLFKCSVRTSYDSMILIYFAKYYSWYIWLLLHLG